eukprot:395548-Pelagomonas_calceolata.AAC.7
MTSEWSRECEAWLFGKKGFRWRSWLVHQQTKLITDHVGLQLNLLLSQKALLHGTWAAMHSSAHEIDKHAVPRPVKTTPSFDAGDLDCRFNFTALVSSTLLQRCSCLTRSPALQGLALKGLARSCQVACLTRPCLTRSCQVMPGRLPYKALPYKVLQGHARSPALQGLASCDRLLPPSLCHCLFSANTDPHLSAAARPGRAILVQEVARNGQTCQSDRGSITRCQQK